MSDDIALLVGCVILVILGTASYLFVNWLLRDDDVEPRRK